MVTDCKSRLGLFTPYGLIYTTGGLGLTWLQSDFLLSSDVDGFESQRVNTVIEYQHIGIPDASLVFSNVQIVNDYATNVNQALNVVKLGVNYKLI